MKKCILMVGPPGSGKSTYARKLAEEGYTYVNQDSQNKEHLIIFDQALANGKNVIVDRMGFNKEQRSRYLRRVQQLGYETEIVVLHENFDTCMDRCLKRENHETIKDQKSASSALNLFFSKYERVSDDEADKVTRIWPEVNKLIPDRAIVVDLDGTLCNIDHRLHFVKNGNKDWKSFFSHMDKDVPNDWCVEIIHRLQTHPIVFCSGRPDTYRSITREWLKEAGVAYGQLYMRNRGDHRDDSIVKENLLDFEILTRFEPYFIIDDRKRVVDMWRRRGYTVLHCAEGDF